SNVWCELNRKGSMGLTEKRQVTKRAAQRVEVDTFLTTRCVLVDEYDQAHRMPPSDWPTRSGPAPSLSRSAVVTLVNVAQWPGFGSGRAVYRYATRQLRAALPACLCAARSIAWCVRHRICWWPWGTGWPTSSVRCPAPRKSSRARQW